VTIEEQVQTFSTTTTIADIALVAPPVTLEKPEPEIKVATSTHPKAPFCGVRSGEWPTEKAMVEAEFGVGHAMVAIARSESRFDPGAWNCASSATGIFQIIIGTWHGFSCTGSRVNPEDNINCARKIYDANGTRDWNASKHVWSKSL